MAMHPDRNLTPESAAGFTVCLSPVTGEPISTGFQHNVGEIYNGGGSGDSKKELIHETRTAAQTSAAMPGGLTRQEADQFVKNWRPVIEANTGKGSGSEGNKSGAR